MLRKWLLLTKGEKEHRGREKKRPQCVHPEKGRAPHRDPGSGTPRAFPPMTKKLLLGGSDHGDTQELVCAGSPPTSVGHGHLLCISAGLWIVSIHSPPFHPSSLVIIPLSINAVKGKVKSLSAADLESVRKGSGHLKRKRQQFPFIANSRVRSSLCYVSVRKYLRLIK